MNTVIFFSSRKFSSHFGLQIWFGIFGNMNFKWLYLWSSFFNYNSGIRCCTCCAKDVFFGFPRTYNKHCLHKNICFGNSTLNFSMLNVTFWYFFRSESHWSHRFLGIHILISYDQSEKLYCALHGQTFNQIKKNLKHVLYFEFASKKLHFQTIFI